MMYQVRVASRKMNKMANLAYPDIFQYISYFNNLKFKVKDNFSLIKKREINLKHSKRFIVLFFEKFTTYVNQESVHCNPSIAFLGALTGPRIYSTFQFQSRST